MSVAELKAIASLDSKPFKAGMGKVTSSAKTGSRQLAATMGAGLKQMAGMIGAAFAVRAVIRFGGRADAGRRPDNGSGQCAWPIRRTVPGT